MLPIGPTVKLEKGGILSLGNLTKRVMTFTAGLRWSPAPGGEAVDVDLWMVLLGKDGKAIDFVRYNENDADAVVVSQLTGSLIYLGDDRDGSSSDTQGKPYDENGLIDLKKAADAGGWKVLIIANIYAPKWMTFDRVSEAAIAVWPGDDIQNAEGAIEISLTDLGRGAKTVIFGWLERGENGDWSIVNKPAMATDINAALLPFGIG